MENINQAIFRMYDIRGIYGEEIDGEVAYRLGRAFAEMIKAETQKENVKIGVSHDMRVSSPELYDKVIEGLLFQGVDVVKFELASTPTFYFGVAAHQLDGGIQISASHNPAKFNGFKLCRKNAIPVSGETGILSLRDAVTKNEFPTVASHGQVLSTLTELVSEQVDFDLTYVDLSKVKPLKIVVDAANAMSSLYFDRLFARLPGELIRLNWELDGNFPNHEADPLKEENNKQLQRKVLEVGADLGISMDGDGDRIFFVTNEGVTIEPAIVRGIMAQVFLKDFPGAAICYDIRPGKITIDMIEEAGGVPVVTRVGHSLIKEKAREVDSPFAGESSGHFFVKMPFGFFEAPGIVTLKLLQLLSEYNKPVSEYVAPLYRYSHSGEINFVVDDKATVFGRLKEKYQDHLKYDFDGVYYEWPEWWFSVRASNTENVVRLNLEAVNRDVMETRLVEVKGLVLGN